LGLKATARARSDAAPARVEVAAVAK